MLRLDGETRIKPRQIQLAAKTSISVGDTKIILMCWHKPRDILKRPDATDFFFFYQQQSPNIMTSIERDPFFEGAGKQKKSSKKSSSKKAGKKVTKKAPTKPKGKVTRFTPSDTGVTPDDYLRFVRQYLPQYPTAPARTEQTYTTSGKVGDFYAKQRVEMFDRLDKEFGNSVAVKMDMFTRNGDLDKLYGAVGSKILYVPEDSAGVGVFAKGLLENGIIDSMSDSKGIKEQMVGIFGNLLRDGGMADITKN